MGRALQKDWLARCGYDYPRHRNKIADSIINKAVRLDYVFSDDFLSDTGTRYLFFCRDFVRVGIRISNHPPNKGRMWKHGKRANRWLSLDASDVEAAKAKAETFLKETK